MKHLLFLVEVYGQLHWVHPDIETPVKNACIPQLLLIAIDLKDLKQAARIPTILITYLAFVLLIRLDLPRALLHLHLLLLCKHHLLLLI